MSLNVDNHVISTGAVSFTMKPQWNILKETALWCTLNWNLMKLKKDCLPAEGLQETVTRALRMFTKSGALYEKYADVTIDCSSKNVQSIVAEIKNVYESMIKEYN